MRYHKEEVAHVGTESVYVKHCRSTRCAFVKAGAENGVTRDLMYIYQPMGFDRQADQMGSLLARFQCRNLAACFLEVLETNLDMRLMETHALKEPEIIYPGMPLVTVDISVYLITGLGWKSEGFLQVRVH